MTIVTMRSRLSDEDVRTLVKGLTDEDRSAAASKICLAIDRAALSTDERAFAEEVLRIMAADASEMVRRSLSVTLQNSTKLPSDVAIKLANDVEAVALPVLMNSPQLSDRDLIEILRSCPPSKQVAVASRGTVSQEITRVIAEVGVAAAVEQALSNWGAVFDEAGLNTALGRFPDHGGVKSAMVRRAALPLSITEKLVSLVSGELFDHLVNNHALPPQMAIDLAVGARERATVDLIEQAARQADLPRFVQQINLHGRLSPSLLMRGMCIGQMSFVEHALAELSGLAHHRVWVMVHDSGPLGLETLFERAGLPRRLLGPFRAAVDVYHEMSRDGADRDAATFRTRMVERVLTLFQHVPKDDLDYLLEKLNAVGVRSERSSLSM
jgi:uncharacterized protein (DUF2336 family)